MMFTRGVISNKIVEVFLDCGATISILSHKFVKQNNIDYHASNIKIKTASNDIISVVGQTDPLNISVHGHECQLT